ncbi:MAG: hypothetical protein AAFP84_05585, partial [Actinomycetota bacterium]
GALDADESLTSLDVALAELGAYGDPIPGAPRLELDGTVLPSLTHAILEIELRRDELTDEQAGAVDAIVESIFPSDEVQTEFAIVFEADEAAESDAEGFAGQGLAAPSSRPPLASPDDADPALRDAVLGAAEAVRSLLGGPRLNIWVQTFDYGTRGDVAGRNVGLDPTDSRRDDHPGNPDCLLQVAVGTTTADIAGIIAHEITHCWQFTRLGLDVGLWNRTGAWVIEGQAAYAGQLIGGLTRFNGNWWGGYLRGLDPNAQWSLYGSSYDAIGFWARIDAGSDIVAAMRRTLDAASSDGAMFEAATSGLGSDVAWLGAGTFQRGEWGGGWTASGAGDPGTPRPAQPHTVIERNDIALSADAGAQANHEIVVRGIAGAEGTIATATGSGLGVIRAPSAADLPLTGSFVEEWCIGSCVCPDGTPAVPADRVEAGDFMIWASLLGGAADSSTLRVRVDEFDPDDPDACEDEEEEEPEPEPEPAGDATGLIGTWRAQPDAIAAMFEEASVFGDDSNPIDVAGATGDLLLTFEEGGTGSMVWSDVTLFLNDEAIGDLTISGGGDFGWGPGAEGINITGWSFSLSVTSSIFVEAGIEPLTITDADVPSGGQTTLVVALADSRLVVRGVDGSAGRVFFPDLWVKQG